MAIEVKINNVSIQYPQIGDTEWGNNATNFAIQTATAFDAIGLSDGTTVDLPGTLDVTGNTTLDANLSVAGIVNVDAGTLYVDPVNNRVGINKTTPVEALDVVGNIAISGNTTITGQALVSDGTALLPGISFSADVDTGFYRISSNTIGITTNGTLRAIINSDGITANVPTWVIADQKPNGTAGGTFSSGAWRTRDLNTTIGTNSITGSSLSSNQFILPLGSYRIFAMAPAIYCTGHKAKLRNITDSSDTLIGMGNVAQANTAGIDGSVSLIIGIFTILSQKTFEIQHYCNTTRFADGFGAGLSMGVVEVFTQVQIWKLA